MYPFTYFSQKVTFYLSLVPPCVVVVVVIVTRFSLSFCLFSASLDIHNGEEKRLHHRLWKLVNMFDRKKIEKEREKERDRQS